MRWPARLVRVIADHRSFLVAEQRLDRGIHVQNPRNPQQRQGRLVEMAAQPDLRVVSGIFFKARRTASSLTTRSIPSRLGLTPSPRTAVM